MAKSELNCVCARNLHCATDTVEAGGRAGAVAQFLVATRGRLPDQTFEAASIAAGAAQFGELCGTFGLICRPRGRYAPTTELSDGRSFL